MPDRSSGSDRTWGVIGETGEGVPGSPCRVLRRGVNVQVVLIRMASFRGAFLSLFLSFHRCRWLEQ